jgi:hypothetical protein
MARPAPCRACCRRRHSLVGLWIIWIGRVRQRDDRKQDRHDARDRTIRGALAISVMSVVGAKAENICSQRVFRLLTHLRLRPDATDMVARPLGPAEIEALSLSQLRQSNIGVRASARCSPQSTIKHCGRKRDYFRSASASCSNCKIRARSASNVSSAASLNSGSSGLVKAEAISVQS